MAAPAVQRRRSSRRPPPGDPTALDVVVVGAGTTGAVVAARLREQGRSVLVLEAGDALGAPFGLDPFAPLALPGRTWDGLLATRAPGREPEPYWQGRGVGGTSAVNGMMATWGRPEDYDAWQCDRWAWADLQPAFRRVEATLRLRKAARLGPVNQMFEAGADAQGIAVERARFTIAGDHRVTVADAYGTSARTGAQVERVLLDGHRAAGVRLVGGEEIEAGDVVVSAGAIHTPAILLRSGIERAALGHNLQDHPAVRVVLRVPPRRRVRSRRQLPFAVLGRRGEVQFVPMDYTDDLATGGVTVALMDARSRGRVTLDAGGAPDVRFDQLADERDRAALLAGIEAVERLFPGAEPPAVDDLGDVFHAAGTCRMGDVADADAVVDVHGQVIGYDGVHVADASIMPKLPKANPMLTCVLIGERFAECFTGSRADRHW